MTTTLDRGGVTSTFHRPAVFWPVVGATAAVTAVSFVATLPSWWTAAVVVGVIAALGIPHGSLDHVVTARMQGGRFSLRRFVPQYLAAMAAVGLVWLGSPTAALTLFLAISIHHFGQSDLAHLAVGGPRQLALQWSRGLLVIALPLLAHLDRVAPVIERLGADSVAGWAERTTIAWPWLAGLVGLHVVALVAAAADLSALELQREATTTIALTTLFLAADPLIGFAVYFGLWHSVNHLLVLSDSIGTGPAPLHGVVRQAAPLTAVSLAGLGVVSLAAVAAGRTELVVPLAFVFISMLTLPHLVVVERLWRWRLADVTPSVRADATTG